MSTTSITNPATTTTVTSTSARLGMMLTDLRLSTIKRLAGDLCAQSDTEGWPAQRLLEALLEHKINERETRRIDRHRNESGLSPGKRLSSFDFSAVPSVSKAQVMALTEGTEWIDRGANVLLFGPPGVGKSHLVSALGHALIDAGRRVLFTRCSDLVQSRPLLPLEAFYWPGAAKRSGQMVVHRRTQALVCRILTAKTTGSCRLHLNAGMNIISNHFLYYRTPPHWTSTSYRRPTQTGR